MPYSGMLPGVVAGHYDFEDALIPLSSLADAARARFVADEIASVDLEARSVRLTSGTTLPFDWLSLDVGSVQRAAVAGPHAHAVGIRPIEAFYQAWQRTLARGEAIGSLAVVGGGAAGVEIVLAMRYRLLQRLGPAAPRCALITDQPALLPGHARGVRLRLGRTIAASAVSLHLDSRIVAFDGDAVITANQDRIAAERIFLATPAAALPWLAESGLACDEEGFVLVDECLQSISHPFVFASGDCASHAGSPYPKSGLYAVRQGPVLAANLRRYRRDAPLIRFEPPSRALALLSTGERSAVLSYGALTAEGSWVWRWKDRIDRRFIARYRSVQAVAARGGKRGTTISGNDERERP